MGISYRFATMADFPTYFELYRQESIENFGAFEGQPGDIEAEWHAPGFDVETMMVLAFDDAGSGAPAPDALADGTVDGTAVAYAEVRAFHTPPVRLYCYGYVAPGYRGRGLGTELIRRAEAIAPRYYARVPDHARVVLQAFSSRDDGRALLGGAGFVATRESLLMDIEFDGPPRAPAFPPGFRIRTLADDLTLEELIAAKEAAFRDHRGSVEQPLEAAVETWRHLIESSKRVFDPALFVLLCDGDVPVGEIMLWTETEESAAKAFVQSLGILPEYRRRGLAEQLLYHGFTEAYKRGKRAVGLSVDGSSLTGADRLYRRVGMHVARTFTAFEKEVRPGVEISNQG